MSEDKAKIEATEVATPAEDKADDLPDETLDQVAGGLNPQPLPPRHGGKGGY